MPILYFPVVSKHSRWHDYSIIRDDLYYWSNIYIYNMSSLHSPNTMCAFTRWNKIYYVVTEIMMMLFREKINCNKLQLDSFVIMLVMILTAIFHWIVHFTYCRLVINIRLNSSLNSQLNCSTQHGMLTKTIGYYFLAICGMNKLDPLRTIVSNYY